MKKIILLTVLSIYITGNLSAKDESDKSALKKKKHEHEKQGEKGHGKHGEKGHEKHGEEGHEEHGEKGHEEHGEKGHDEHGEKGHEKHDDIGHEEHTEKGHGGHGDHEEGGKAVGKGKAIAAVDEMKGFKLSNEAIKTLKLKLKVVNGDEFEIAKSTLVASKDLRGVYRFRGGFFKLLKVKILKETKNGYKVKVAGVEFGDQIVTNGLGLLRISDVYSTDKSNYGHSH